jgi:3-oxoacyl-[acyl-carrier-protein] synthase-3
MSRSHGVAPASRTGSSSSRHVGVAEPRSRILGTGHYAPERVVTNQELEGIVDTTDAWITTRTGIKQRHVAAEGEASSDMAVAAARKALDAAGLTVADLDMIIVGTITADSPIPSCAAHVQHKLGADDIAAFDISAACAGFLFGLSIGDQFIGSGAARCVLVIGVELLTRKMNWDDRTTCVLFGDGAGAVVLGPSEWAPAKQLPRPDNDLPAGILSSLIFTDGSLASALQIPAGGSAEPASQDAVEQKRDKVHMVGKDVFRTAVRNLTASSAQALKAAGLTSKDLDWVVAHQANLRIINQVASRLGFPLEKFVINIHEYGNTSSASIPIALDEAVRDGRIQPGQTVLLCALGAGISWGAAIVRM